MLISLHLIARALHSVGHCGASRGRGKGDFYGFNIMVCSSHFTTETKWAYSKSCTMLTLRVSTSSRSTNLGIPPCLRTTRLALLNLAKLAKLSVANS